MALQKVLRRLNLKTVNSRRPKSTIFGTNVKSENDVGCGDSGGDLCKGVSEGKVGNVK